MTKISASNEFQINPFAKFYEPITDSFIDIKRSSDSLKRYLIGSKELFEIGLGTGYFAAQFIGDGYKVRGIQPKDELLSVLKQKNIGVEIVAECKLEDYQFTEKHETIVSHSSVFLFTEHESRFGQNGEMLKSYVFQSFIVNKKIVLDCLHKTLNALTIDGRLFINIQINPLPFITIENNEEMLTFSMTECNYFLEMGYVEKKFNLTYTDQIYEVEDIRFCETYGEFVLQMQAYGFQVLISDDRQWIIVERV